jgi:arsenical-resistance protein
VTDEVEGQGASAPELVGGGPTVRKPSVLFVCVHNAGRSQMAAGWLTALAGDTIEVRSAGTAPADQVNPVAVRAMAEVGIDLTRATPKVLAGEAVQASDVVITMGCGDTCPYYPGTRYLDWSLDDPAGQGIEAVRSIRDAIRARVEQLIVDLLPDPPARVASPSTAVDQVGGHIVARLSRLDRFLPVWIIAAMAAGLVLGRTVQGLNDALDTVKVAGVSLPIAFGLLVMMYPVLAKVRYDRLDTVTRDTKLIVPSLVLNWLVGPALMFALAWVFLPDQPTYRTGLIIVGLARCIAMVIIWNDLAGGDREAAAVLVALNSVFQVLAFGILGWFYVGVLPGWLHLPGARLDISAWDIARNVLIFLGIPLAAGYLTRTYGERVKGRDWYETRFLPKIGPTALYGLLFTVVILFALQGDAITTRPWDVARIALPLLAYFTIMWAGSFALGRALGLGYPRTTTLAFTAASNNFELAIAVAIATFGVTSGQALAGVVGPLIEVPVLVGLVYVALAVRALADPPAMTPPRPA